MIKGVKMTLVNTATDLTAYAGTYASAYPLLTVPTGKTFVVTDVVAGFIPSGSLAGTFAALPGVGLVDRASVAAGTAMTIGQYKVTFRPDFVMATTASNCGLLPKPLAITGIQNGPEFSTCVTAGNIGTWTIPTYGLYVGGYLR